MTDVDGLTVVAEALELASRHIRAHLVRVAEDEHLVDHRRPVRRAVEEALARRPRMGHRQQQIIEVLDEAGPAGTDMGRISRRIRYEQPNVYQALANMASWGFVEKDVSTDPHTYRLGREIRPSESDQGTRPAEAD